MYQRLVSHSKYSIGQRFSFTLLILATILFSLLLIGCQRSQELQIPTGTPTPTVSPTVTSPPVTVAITGEESAAQPTEAQVIATPTPAPTATPSPLDIAVDDIVERVGIQDLIILGLSGENLVNFLISLLIVLLGSILGSLLINWITWFTKFTPIESDGQILARIKKQLKWLIGVFLLDIATARLVFLSSNLKQWADLFYLALYVIMIASIFWRLTDFALEVPIRRAATPKDRGVLIAFTPLLRRTIQILVFIVGLVIILKNFGVNLGALVAILGLGGLAVSLAAKETLEDLINGFILLIDRPFQIGDRIRIETMDTWGDVEDIGSRTTRIRTLDNRLVIVPNSVIGRNQVENYTSTDPSIRLDVKLGIVYGSDIDQVLNLIEGAVLEAPGVMRAKLPIVEFIEFGDSAMIFQVFYWLNTYSNFRQVRSHVNKAIYVALTEAGIEMPYITYDVHLTYKDKTGEVSHLL